MAEKCKFAKDGAKAGYYFDCLDCPKETCEEPELRKRFFDPNGFWGSEKNHEQVQQ